MKKVICTKCKKFVDYSIEYKQEKTTIKEKEITYFKAEAHCKECGAIVWVEEIEEQNILAPIDQFIKCPECGCIIDHDFYQNEEGCLKEEDNR